MKYQAMLVVAGAALLGLFSSACLSQDAATLEMLIDRAVDRQRRFDGVQARFSFETMPAPGRRSPAAEGASRRSSAQGSAPRRRSEVTVTTSLRWAKSGDKSGFDGQVDRTTKAGQTTSTFKYATDGAGAKALVKTAHGYLGFVSSGDRVPFRTMMLTPDRLGVTGLPSTTGTLSNCLEGVPVDLTMRRRGGEETNIHVSRDVRLVGEETVNGHECTVVEVAERWSGGGLRGRDVTGRLYFAKDFNYACVRFERGGKRDGEFAARSRWTFGDFREVKDGLFVPFSAASERVSRTGTWQKMMACKVDDISFPGEVDAALLDFEFPPGTLVRDRTAGFSYTTGDAALEKVDFLLADVSVETAPQEESPTPQPPAEETAPAGQDNRQESRQNSSLVVSILVGAGLVALAVVLVGVIIRVMKNRR